MALSRKMGTEDLHDTIYGNSRSKKPQTNTSMDIHTHTDSSLIYTLAPPMTALAKTTF